MMGRVLEDRKRNPPSNGERLFIDELIDLDISDAVRRADMLTVLIASVHTTGLRESKAQHSDSGSVWVFFFSADLVCLLCIEGARNPGENC